MKTKLLCGLTFMIMMFTACSDELENNTRYADGMLHFKFLLNEKDGAWNDDGASGPKTRMMAPVEMTTPEGFDAPLYLHCEETNAIEDEMPAADDTAAVTRGQRITGEAFDPTNPNAVTSLGLYAVVGGEEVLKVYDKSADADDESKWITESNFTEIQRSSLDEEGGWYVREQDLWFGGAGEWTNTKTGNFYGFAPYPGWDGTGGNPGHTSCIVVNTDDPNDPKLNFTMNEDEAFNKDILTARKMSVTQAQKDEGIELQFQHALTALKFKLDPGTAGDPTKPANDMMYTIGIGSSAVNYYIQVKSIRIEGIYDQGSVGIGNAYTDTGSSRTSNWTVDDTHTGSCTATIDRSYGDVTGDANKLINTDEHCLMVLPQKTPSDGAKLIITADLTTEATGGSVFMSDATFEASLCDMTWLPGYSYTYKISKDKFAFAYTLQSVYGGTPGGTFSIGKDGGSFDFNVTSYMDRLNEDATTTRKVCDWHVEHSTDGGSTWTKGLPVGFLLQNKSTQDFVGNSSTIPGSETAVTYTLTAPERIEDSDDITTLSSNDYSMYAGDDGYYDLSLHKIGFSPDICSQTTERNTANCYIVNGYGKFKIPLVYGNGVKKGINNPKAYAYKWGDPPSNHNVFTDHEGNAITTPWIFGTEGQLGRSVTGAELLWQDAENVIRRENIRALGDYLYFEILPGDVQPANIVLAVKDGSDIAWSWHIWVTAYDDWTEDKTVSLTSPDFDGKTYTMKVAKRNLGWSPIEIKQYSSPFNFKIRIVQNDIMGSNQSHNVEQAAGLIVRGGSNIIYQQGRKDPFPNSYVSLKEGINSASEITDNSYRQLDRISSFGITISNTIANNMSELIKNPKKIYRNASGACFYASDAPTTSNYMYYNSWNPEFDYTKNGSYSGGEYNYKPISKTIYDPCPVGFRVPNGGISRLLAGTDFTYNPLFEEKVDGIDIPAPIPSITHSSGLKFYLAGCRRMRYYREYGISDKDENGNYVTSNSYGLTEFQTYGYFWTTGTYDNGGYGVCFRSENNKGTSNTGFYGVQGFAIRPVWDDVETVESYETTPASNFFQGDELDVNLVPNGLNWGISDLTGVSFTITIDGTPNTYTLKEILDDATKRDKRIFIKNIRVYFTYNGYTYGVLIKRTQNPYKITYNGTESKGSEAYVLVSSIPDHYQFCARWSRQGSNDNNNNGLSSSDATTRANAWANLVPLTSSKVEITSVKADLRITYYE